MRVGKRERGAELVEFSLVMIPLFGILSLVIDLAWMLFARAVTGQTISGMGQDASIKSVVQVSMNGTHAAH